MTSRDNVLAKTEDPDGRQVVLLSELWTEKVLVSHPELAGCLDSVIATVAEPSHTEPDPFPKRTRFYKRDVGPSRWLMVVVSFEQEPARIITAVANRKDPKQWKP